MPNILYDANDFTGTFASLNGANQILTITWPQLVWAAVTAGKALGAEYAFGIYSTFERIHRASMMYAYLLQGDANRLQQTDAFHMSDPSEKGAISYSFGITLAKLFAELVMDAPRLLHFGIYQGDYQIMTQEGNSRPDLIGLTTNGDWVVFEAKGRSNGLDSAALIDAKDQTMQILTIDNLVPICRVGSIAYFPAAGLKFRMDDPEPEDKEKGRRIHISKSEFDERYYGSIRQLITSRDRIRETTLEGIVYTEARIDEADISIGIPEDLEDHPTRRPRRQVSPFIYIGGDEVLVRLGESWSEANMRLQPHLRHG